MPVYRRTVTLPLELTAPDPAAADRDAMDLGEFAAEAAAEHDVSGALSVGRLTVTTPPPVPAPRWIVVYGAGERATAQVCAWLTEGGVDSYKRGGLWVHRPATAAAGSDGAR